MITLKDYKPHAAQQAFHYASDHLYRYLLYVSGIRGGKTYAGAREAGKQAWNSEEDGAFGIIAPTFNMLERTTWVEFIEANRPLILMENKSDKIAVLKNGRRVFGFSAEKPDRIRNTTLVGAWCDEAREFKNFKEVWKILLGRVLSTNGKIFVTTSPNSYDDIYDIFVQNKKPGYGIVKAPTYANTYLKKEAIDSLAEDYDVKFAQQELGGDFVLFEGQVYYTFNRKHNAGDYALKHAIYNPNLPLRLMCDFNVDPMAWVVSQFVQKNNGLVECYFIDEIVLKNSNTYECCTEFKSRYPNHRAGIILYGDATGQARHSSSNKTNWAIVKDELDSYGVDVRIPSRNPNERDRINAVNAMVCNSKGVRRVHANPNRCKKLIRDLEQVSFKEGSCHIDKTKNLELTHPSDAMGYGIEREFSLINSKLEGLKI